MANKRSSKTNLRVKAESQVKNIPDSLPDLTMEKAKTLLHELEVHQVELEMQNQELRETQHRLEEARDQYTSLFDFAPIGYLILDEKGIIKNINLTGCDMLGIERSQIMAKPLSAYMSKGESSTLFLKLKEAFKTGILPSFELQVKNKRRGSFTALFHGTVSRDEKQNGSICRMSVQDVTELREAESLQQQYEALQKEKENIQQYLDLAPVVILLIDNEYKVQMMNQKGYDLIGYESSEILHKNWFENFISEINSNEIKELTLNSENKNLPIPAYFESNLVCKNGELLRMVWTNAPLFDKKGNLIGTVIAGEDITERKRLELSKQVYTEELEKIVEERTKELNEALQNEKMINEMKSAFISMASHEFRTPLTSIMSSAILVKKYIELSDLIKSKRHIERIKSSVNQLTNILEDFLSVDKLESGQVNTKKNIFDLRVFTQEIIEELGWMLKEEQKINYTHTGETVIFLDKKILRNIYVNLISNAIKYSETTVKIHTAVQKGRVIISFKDEGLGIPADEQKHLFTKFFRARNVLNIPGTGLGLSIVKHYLDLLGGTIDFDSKAGKGSVFKLTLPQTNGS